MGIIVEPLVWTDDQFPVFFYMMFPPLAFNHGLYKSLSACGTRRPLPCAAVWTRWMGAGGSSQPREGEGEGSVTRFLIGDWTIGYGYGLWDAQQDCADCRPRMYSNG